MTETPTAHKQEIVNPVPTQDDDNEEPLDCSAGPDDSQKQRPTTPTEFPEYKLDVNLINPEIRHLTPEVECIQRPAGLPHSEQENMDTMLNAQMLPFTAPRCQSDSVGK